ncbi:MAG: EAL domain-containing protein [Lachnospiraceae bacterium]
MKSIHILYQGKETLTHLIDQNKLQREIPYFIQIITASKLPNEAVELACSLQSEFYDSTIMGFSASKLIYKGEQHSTGTLLIFRRFEKTNIIQKSFTWKEKNANEIALEIAEAFSNEAVSLMHVICSEQYYDVHNFVEAFNKCDTNIPMVGGVAGDILNKNILGFVFTPNGVIEKGILICALCGNDISFYTGVNTSHEPISGIQKLTNIKDNYWLEVNGQDIHQWLFDQLGLEQLKTYSDKNKQTANEILVHFPMMLEGYQNASRFLSIDDKSGRVSQHYNCLPVGTEFRIGYVNPTECIQESFRLYNEIISHPTEELFCYSCIFRAQYLKSCSDWEISHYKNIDLCGAFMMGEISYINGRNEFLNGSCTLVGIAENETYIRPDIQAFNELTSIGDDTTKLLNVVLKSQQKTSSKQNEKLMQTLLSQHQFQNEQIYIDFNTGLPNYLKFKEDLKTKNFDKICIMKTENSELLITHLGHNAYLEIIRNILKNGQSLLSNIQKTESSIMQLYVFNESIFFVAVDESMSESHFMRICKNVHDENHLIHTKNEEVVITRFVVCLHQSNPIESALNSLAANQNTQKSFLICQDNDITSSHEEFKMIGVLNRSFENDTVIPYFQGIYSNMDHIIDYYEALMRIQDVDGTIYAPGQFIDIAKKYHMYTKLSRTMINKVFLLFSDRNESVSINITVFDIQSTKTKQMIYKRLHNCKNPNNFIFEILEDEAYQDFEPLKEFIHKVRSLGARIAIDDFGSGYSNLYEISNIKFDILKVDGGIIRDLPYKESNRKLLDVITHMGQLFHAKIVAEYVETQEIQDIIEKTEIHYSQGYLFAKPLPFLELGSNFI